MKKLEIAFNSKLLRTICEDETNARKEIGVASAEILKHRLADLHAATSTMDLLVGHPQLLNDDQMVIDLVDDLKLVFCPNHPEKPLNAMHEIDWPRVSRIKILLIGRIDV